MDISLLTTDTSREQFFVEIVKRRVDHFYHWLPPHLDNTEALDGVQDSLLRTVSMGLGVIDAWEQIYALLNQLAPYMERRGFWSNWQRYIRYGLKIATMHQDTSKLAELRHLLARTQMRRSDYTPAVRNYRRTIRLARQVGDAYNEARACTNLGHHYVELGHWWRAEVLCRHALKVFGRLRSDHGLAHTHNHLGLLYIRCRLWQQAEQELLRACEIWDRMSDDYGLMWGYMNLGLLFNEIDQANGGSTNMDKALLYSGKSRKKALKLGDDVNLGTAHMNIGITYWWSGQYALAEQYEKEALNIFERFVYFLGQAQAKGNLALICRDQERWGDAERHFEESLTLFRQLGHTEREIKTMLEIVQFEIDREDRGKARGWAAEIEKILLGRGGQYQVLIDRYKQYRRDLEST